MHRVCSVQQPCNAHDYSVARNKVPNFEIACDLVIADTKTIEEGQLERQDFNLCSKDFQSFF